MKLSDYLLNDWDNDALYETAWLEFLDEMARCDEDYRCAAAEEV